MEFAWIKGVIYNRRLTLCGLQVTGKRETQYKVEYPLPTCRKPRYQIRGLVQNHSFENQFCLRVNIKLFSSERVSTRNLFENKAKGKFEIAIKMQCDLRFAILHVNRHENKNLICGKFSFFFFE